MKRFGVKTPMESQSPQLAATQRKGVIGDYEITREPNNSISLIRTYGKGNGMQGLRECAAHFGFEIDPKWNNRQIAPNLIKFIHKLDKADKEAKE